MAPQTTHESPRFAFTQQHVDDSVDDAHGLGNRLPALTNHGTVQQLSPDLHSFAGASNAPKSMQEMMELDAPLLSVHVTHFTDATVIAVSWPHPLMDALGLQALMRNWSLVLNDRLDQVQPLAGVHIDVLKEAIDKDTSTKEALLIEKISIGVLGMIILLFRFLGLKLWNPGFEERTIILSQGAVDRLYTAARDDLIDHGDEKVFISEGDVLAAWVAQILAASQSKPRPVTIASFINLRFRLPTLQDKGADFIQNLLQFVYVSFELGCASATLGSMAASYRQQLKEQSTHPQLLSFLRMQFGYVKKYGKLRLVFGDPQATMLTVNNLTKVDFFCTIDFSGAVVSGNTERATADSSMNPPGTIVYYHPLVLNEPSVVTSHLRILGKDHNGRVLMTGTFQRSTWDMIVEQLALLL